MPRRPRADTGGYVYHVLNRAVGRALIFHKDGDYTAFERVLRQAKDKVTIRLLAYSLMPNHFHLVLWPRHDGELSDFLHWLTLTHTMRWHAHYHSSGTGPLYQGRFKSFPIQEDDHLFTVCRYVERNPLRAQLVPRAEAWPWSSLARRAEGRGLDLLDGWPLPVPLDWRERVNGIETASDLAALRRSVRRGAALRDGSVAGGDGQAFGAGKHAQAAGAAAERQAGSNERSHVVRHLRSPYRSSLITSPDPFSFRGRTDRGAAGKERLTRPIPRAREPCGSLRRPRSFQGVIRPDPTR